jgi:pimeloyl-ACP methyl ester carboxylesterase
MRAVVLGLLAIACRGADPAEPRTVASPAASIERRDEIVESERGIAIAFREVTVRGHDARVAVVLVHGAGGGGVSSFDPPVAGYSLAEDLARAGHPTYVIDVRGWGHSTRPAVVVRRSCGVPARVGMRVCRSYNSAMLRDAGRHHGNRQTRHASGERWPCGVGVLT